MVGVGATSTTEQRKHAPEENRTQRNEKKNAQIFSDGECWSEWWCSEWVEEIQWMNAEEHTRKCVLCQQCLHSIDTKTESKQEKGTKKKKKTPLIFFYFFLHSLSIALFRVSHIFGYAWAQWKIYLWECERLLLPHKRPEDISRCFKRRQISIGRRGKKNKIACALAEWVPTFNGKITPLLVWAVEAASAVSQICRRTKVPTLHMKACAWWINIQ